MFCQLMNVTFLSPGVLIHFSIVASTFLFQLVLGLHVIQITPLSQLFNIGMLFHTFINECSPVAMMIRLIIKINSVIKSTYFKLA